MAPFETGRDTENRAGEGRKARVIQLKRGDIEGGLSLLQKSITSGLEPSDRAGLAADEDWKSLRGDPRFQALASPAGK